MLTIKIIRPDNSEWIEEASSVSLEPSDIVSNSIRGVTYFKNDRSFFVTSGHVYVMNENGKTIASYEIPQDMEVMQAAGG